MTDIGSLMNEAYIEDLFGKLDQRSITLPECQALRRWVETVYLPRGPTAASVAAYRSMALHYIHLIDSVAKELQEPKP